MKEGGHDSDGWMPGDRIDRASVCSHQYPTSLVRDLKIPEVGKIYSFNEGNMDLWDSGIQEYIKSLKSPEKWSGKPYSARYIGSLVGDFHR